MQQWKTCGLHRASGQFLSAESRRIREICRSNQLQIHIVVAQKWAEEIAMHIHRVVGIPAAIASVVVAVAAMAAAAMTAGRTTADDRRAILMNPDAPEWKEHAPATFRVRLETTKRDIVIEVHRDWSPNGADRFYNLVRFGYYDDTRFFRVIAGRWAQFGISGDPEISKVWRSQTIPDDPRVVSNTMGTIAFAFAVPNGRATQVFINLRDNSTTHDPGNFVPFGIVVDGMEGALELNSEYGEHSGSGIRAGHQDMLFDEGNAYLDREFPRLDRLIRAVIVRNDK
jgi:peptidyl-prolyl cis-trans isomerase A (cyclophilin A)